MKRKPSYAVKIINNGFVKVPIEAGYKALLDRIFGLTRKELNKPLTRLIKQGVKYEEETR